MKRTGIDLSVAGYVGRKGKGRKPIEGVAGKLGPDRQEAFEAESIKQITAYVKDKAKSDKALFHLLGNLHQQLQGSKAHHNDKHVDKANAQASEMAAHNAHVKQLLDTLKAEGIAENTLVVWISDNGPMYAFYRTPATPGCGRQGRCPGGRRARSGDGLVAGHDRAQPGPCGHSEHHRSVYHSRPPGWGA